MIDEKKVIHKTEQQANPIVKEESQGNYKKTDIEDSEEQKRKKAAKIDDLQKEKNQLTEKIKQARNTLGLPQTDEEPPSVQALNNQIKKIENEDTTIDQSQTEIDAYIEKAEKQKFLNFVDSVQKIVYSLKKRGNDRLRPLIEEKNLNTLLSAVSNIKDMIEQKISRDDWSNNLIVEIKKIQSAVDSIGDIRRMSSFGEDPESLSNLRSKLKTLEEDCNIVKEKQNPELTEQNKAIKKTLNDLSQSCKGKWQFIARLGQAFENYKKVR